MEIIVKNEGGLDAAAKQLLCAIGERRVIALHGAMGAGKTTLVAAICRALGSKDIASSPTFAIVNEYEGGDSPLAATMEPPIKKIYHFDFYRIEDFEEAEALALDDYFDSGALCLMEWPDNAEPFLPADTLHLTITADPDDTRHLTFKE